MLRSFRFKMFEEKLKTEMIGGFWDRKKSLFGDIKGTQLRYG